MNIEEIEQLKRERDAAIEAGLKLAELGAGTGVSRNTEWEGAVENLKSLRPKPERLRCWIERDRGGLFEECHFTEPSASLMVRIRTQQNTIHPMIEVRPLPELPEMEEWDKERVTSEMKHSERSPFDDYRELVSRHNATVRAFKKWAEDAKKEAGDE